MGSFLKVIGDDDYALERTFGSAPAECDNFKGNGLQAHYHLGMSGRSATAIKGVNQNGRCTTINYKA